jgi:hypothetical protein
MAVTLTSKARELAVAVDAEMTKPMAKAVLPAGVVAVIGGLVAMIEELAYRVEQQERTLEAVMYEGRRKKMIWHGINDEFEHIEQG